MNSPLNDTQALAPHFDSPSGQAERLTVQLRSLQAVPARAPANWRMAEGPDKLIAARASGSHIWDVAGRDYVDYVSGVGSVLLGHAHPDINAAMAAQLELGIQTGVTHLREIQLADEVCASMPGMDAVRFHIDSTAAIQTALKIARVATSRELVVRFAGQAHGHLPLGKSVTVPWNDADALRAAFNEHGTSIAAVIAEPLMSSRGGFEPATGFLTLVRQLTTASQSVFILNESVTGLRLHYQGAIGKYLLTGNLGPDLIIGGQCLGNGAPISALAGRAKLMELLVTHAVDHTHVFDGGSFSVAAGLALLSRLRLGGQAMYQQLYDQSHVLMEKLAELASEAGVPFTVRGPGPIFWVDLARTPATVPHADTLASEHPRYRRFRAGMLDHGVRLLPGGAWYLNAAHTDADLDLTLEAARAVFTGLGDTA